MAGWISRLDRKSVSIGAIVRLSTGRLLPVTIIDVTRSGCKIRCLQMLPIGEVVELEIPAFQPNVASVRWSLPGRAGLLFV
jgi:hypothetical protein